MTPPAASEPAESDGREALINPGEAVGPAGPARPGVEAARRTLAEYRDGASRDPGHRGAGRVRPVWPRPTACSGRRSYEESGRIYAALAARNLLPAERRPHWAYCRFKSVVRRINAAAAIGAGVGRDRGGGPQHPAADARATGTGNT